MIDLKQPISEAVRTMGVGRQWGGGGRKGNGGWGGAEPMYVTEDRSCKSITCQAPRYRSCCSGDEKQAAT